MLVMSPGKSQSSIASSDDKDGEITGESVHHSHVLSRVE